MLNANDPSHDESTYFVDSASAAEIARLINQDALITSGMGGLLTSIPDISTLHTILDLACGPGGWSIEVAFHYPDKQIQGIDINQTMMDYANAKARVQNLSNVSFRQMDVLGPLDFDDNTFDLVNSRFISGFMFPATWHSLLQEVLRVVRPGGLLRFTEGDDWGITSSAAFEHIMSWSIQALQASMQSFFPAGRHIGITAMLPRLFHEAGCINIQKQWHVIDYSYGTAAYEGFCNNWRVFFQLLRPFLIKWKVATGHEFDVLYNQMLVEMYDPLFQATGFFLTVVGEKPRAE